MGAANEAVAREPAAPAGQADTPGVTSPRTRSHSGQFITDIIADLGYLPREQVDAVISESRSAGRSPESILVERGMIDGDQLSRAIAERYGLDHIDLNSFQVDMGAANLVSTATARRYGAVPVAYHDENTLILAMTDPANVLAIDDIQMMTYLSCRVAVAAEADIEALVGRLSTLDHAVSEVADEEEEEAQISDIRESAEDGPVIKLVYSILGQAVADGASDIHFEAEEKDMRV
ncbi:MAG: hypothetical protein ACR2K6_04675, partial [Solirubrobacterales bacterium]